MSGGRRVTSQRRALPMTDQTRWLWLRPPPAATTLAGWALLPLRAFLGFTFCFAGLQKLANPSFFRASNPAGIQAQMLAASRRSPIHALLTPLALLVALKILYTGFLMSPLKKMTPAFAQDNTPLKTLISFVNSSKK